MKLNTLGQLRLENEKFRREKPLLLLAYLTLEGHKPRRFLAQLFWPDAGNAMNNLAVALAHLRKLGVAEADHSHAWAEVACDALELQRLLRASQLEQALELYRGAFVDVGLNDLSPELENWVLDTRESLAAELRISLLWKADEHASQSDFARAGELTEAAYRLVGAAAVEPEELPRFYHLLRVADHPLCQTIEREAKDMGLSLGSVLEVPIDQMRQRLSPILAGRQSELERLRSLQAGEWAYLRGGAGCGKTTLLQELRQTQTADGQKWLYLPARSGLPYATLETLFDDLETNQTMLLRQLARVDKGLLIDDWEAVDSESRELLERLHALRPQIPVVLAGKIEAPFDVTFQTELGVLTADELQDVAGAFEATGGVPTLVGAFLRQEDLSEALEERLLRLSEPERQLYNALNLLSTVVDRPDLRLVRLALGWSAAQWMQVSEQLQSMGLIEASGKLCGKSVALSLLKSEENILSELSLSLARVLPKKEALPLYQRCRLLWDDSDQQALIQTYTYWGEELLRRGFPKKAVQLLQDAPPYDELRLLQAHALERNGLFRQALDQLETLPQTSVTAALRSRVLYKLGFPAEAAKAAEMALSGSLEAEAEALNTLGEIALRKGSVEQALDRFGRSATLWQAAGQTTRWLRALNNRAVARTVAGGFVEEAFAEVLGATAGNPSRRAAVLTNMAQGYLHQKEPQLAESAYKEAIELSVETGTLSSAVVAWNGLGVMYHYDKPSEAKKAYQQGLELAREMGDAQLTAVLLANLAELESDIPAWEQAIELLERGGFLEMAREVRANLETFMAC